MTNIGDNTLAGDRLKSFIERIERLEEDKQGIAADIRELKAEARAEGFDPKIINEMLRLRKMDALAREEFEARRDTYMHALGMLADTPLGEAARLGLPLVTLKMDQLICSKLGGTGQNIANIFESIAAQEETCVLFMDEFDAIGSKRTDDPQAVAREMNNIVNALLTRIEAFKGTAIAATNRANAIDPAMWRRFGMHLDVALPGFQERYAILRRYLYPFEIPDNDLDTLSDVTDGASPALIRQLMEGIKRALILNPRLNRSTDPDSIFAALMASIKPHPDYAPPPLWHDQTALSRACGIQWPPQLRKLAS